MDRFFKDKWHYEEEDFIPFNFKFKKMFLISVCSIQFLMGTKLRIDYKMMSKDSELKRDRTKQLRVYEIKQG